MTVRSEGQFNTIIYEEADSYRNASQRWVVFLNAQDIQVLGLQEGDSVTVTSPRGSMEGLTLCAFDLPRGNAMAYFPEANVLIGRESDPRSKTPAFKSVPIAVRAC
jgi:anaerobic selenocysteine-containing dehydrogenase